MDDYSFEENDHEFEYKPDCLSHGEPISIRHVFSDFQKYCNARNPKKLEDGGLWLVSKEILDKMAKEFEESHTNINNECVVIKRNPPGTELWFVDDVVIYHTGGDE